MEASHPFEQLARRMHGQGPRARYLAPRRQGTPQRLCLTSRALASASRSRSVGSTLIPLLLPTPQRRVGISDIGRYCCESLSEVSNEILEPLMRFTRSDVRTISFHQNRPRPPGSAEKRRGSRRSTISFLRFLGCSIFLTL